MDSKPNIFFLIVAIVSAVAVTVWAIYGVMKDRIVVVLFVGSILLISVVVIILLIVQLIDVIAQK